MSEGQEAPSLWRMEGCFLGEKGYPWQKGVHEQQEGLGQPHPRNTLATCVHLPLPTAALHISRQLLLSLHPGQASVTTQVPPGLISSTGESTDPSPSQGLGRNLGEDWKHLHSR